MKKMVNTTLENAISSQDTCMKKCTKYKEFVSSTQTRQKCLDQLRKKPLAEMFIRKIFFTATEKILVYSCTEDSLKIKIHSNFDGFS